MFQARVGKRSQRGEIYPPWKGIPWAITGTRKEKAQMETIDPRSVKKYSPESVSCRLPRLRRQNQFRLNRHSNEVSAI